MAKGLHELLTTAVNANNASNDQKAFRILIETLDPKQYQYVDDIANVKTVYEALVTHHQRITKIDRIEVAMEWAKINWNPRQETLPDFFLRFSLLVKRQTGVGADETDINIVIKLLALMPRVQRGNQMTIALSTLLEIDQLVDVPQLDEVFQIVEMVAVAAEWQQL
ncbi:unnamed protein product [Aphanomyces euteiches]